MEKEFAKAKRQINNILKKLGDSSCDWILQISQNSADPRGTTYACMIHASDRLEPITWVKGSWEELHEALEQASKDLSREIIDVAYMKGEIDRCERLKAYYEEKIAEITTPRDSSDIKGES